MKNVIRLNGSRSLRPAQRAASTAAVAAVVAVVAGILAGPGTAAPQGHADDASRSDKEARFQEPHLRHGLLTIEGTEGSDEIALRLQAGEPLILQVDVGDDGSADFNFERGEIERIAVAAGAGDDLVRIDETNGSFTDSSPTAIVGGPGDDVLAGGSGAEALLGGPGDDSLDGNRGADVALMGAGDDTFVWDPGDGSDTVEGQAGTDTMLFNGANVAEQVDLTANGNRLTFFRNPGNITMDTAGVERVDFNALGGADAVTVNDLTATDVTDVNLNLAGTLGGATGDSQVDRITVNATDGDDVINISGGAGGVKMSGLAATIAIRHPEAANDTLEIDTLAGRDTVDSGDLAAGAIQLVVDGTLVPQVN